MPVERFRSIEEMSADPIRVVSGDAFERVHPALPALPAASSEALPRPAYSDSAPWKRRGRARERASSEAMRTRG